MATNITGVSMPTPASDPEISPNGNFTMGGVISVAGGGSSSFISSGWAKIKVEKK